LNQRIAANHQILNVLGVEKSQQFAEVGVDEHRHVLSHARREQSVTRWRQSGIEAFDFANTVSQRIDPGPQFFLDASF
jgi:hypothetical protein